MLNIILFEPEIPENTGNIARTCVGFNATLHLIRPYGFILSNAKLKRSGVDYWDKLVLKEYDSFQEFNELNNNPKIYMFTKHGDKTPSDIDFSKQQQDIYLMFGRESKGIDKDILKSNLDNLIRIPTSINIRSLNLSNTVAIACYEVMKQLSFPELELLEPHKKGFLLD